MTVVLSGCLIATVRTNTVYQDIVMNIMTAILMVMKFIAADMAFQLQMRVGANMLMVVHGSIWSHTVRTSVLSWTSHLPALTSYVPMPAIPIMNMTSWKKVKLSVILKAKAMMPV